jgi:hypothetical protein
MISFGFEDSFKDGFEEGFVEGTAFRGLSETIGRIETFFLAETEAGTGTRGTEAEAGAAETFGTVGVVGTVGTEAKVTLAVGIVGTVEAAGTETGTETGVACALEIAGIVGTARIAGIADSRSKGSPRNGGFFLCPAQQKL